MTDKKLIIIVPGSKTKASRFQFIDRFLKKFYTHFGVDTENDDRWTSELKEVFKKEIPNTEIHVFNWSGGFAPWSTRKAAKSLCLMLDTFNIPDTTLFCKSLGGRVGELAAFYSGREINLIEVATPHGPFELNIPRTHIINIYSLQDKYLNLGNRVLYLGFGKNILKQAKNICLTGISHSGFNKNIEINSNGEKTKLFEFYKQLIFPNK